jgi:hypothetical protein
MYLNEFIIQINASNPSEKEIVDSDKNNITQELAKEILNESMLLKTKTEINLIEKTEFILTDLHFLTNISSVVMGDIVFLDKIITNNNLLKFAFYLENNPIYIDTVSGKILSNELDDEDYLVNVPMPVSVLT